MAAYTINFEPVGRRGECQDNESFLDCARRIGVGISSVCGGLGTCHSCRVRILSGTVSETTSSDRETFSNKELEAGWRLACRTYPTSDCTLNIPPGSMTTSQRTQVEGLEVAVDLEPSVKDYHLKLPMPSLSQAQADADRLLETLNRQHRLHCTRVDVQALRELSPRLRDWQWQCRAAVRGDEVVAVLPESSRGLGLAVDLGTTKIAGYLVDLNSGQTLVSRGIMNPQIGYGEDIITRITRVIETPDMGVELQRLVITALNQLAAELCEETGKNVAEIVDMVVVGNTAMHHLLLGLPVRQLALSPFVSAVNQALDIKARDLGLHIASGAYVHVLPNIAGFVGADHVAVLLATEVGQAEGLTVAIDIGTNTEVSLVNGGQITAVSCASGPAFEGGHIKDGMRAASGAIEKVRLVNDAVQYQTIDGAPPVGICGSGILDAMAQLHLAGVIDKGGRMKDGHPRLRRRNKRREFVLVSEEERGGQPAIVITQGDIRELQLAKAAIRTGIRVLLEANGCSEAEIGQVIIAGAFGTYIDVASAIAIGMLPSLSLERFQQVGNAAGMGARLALVSLSKRAEAQTIASRVNYIELASFPNFMQTFVEAGYLGG